MIRVVFELKLTRVILYHIGLRPDWSRKGIKYRLLFGFDDKIEWILKVYASLYHNQKNENKSDLYCFASTERLTL